MFIYLPALVLLIGGLIFGLSKTNGDLKEIGRMMFFAGLLTFLMNGEHIISGIGR